MTRLLLSFFLFCSFQCYAQIIVTVGGNGTAGFSGDGGPATAATFKRVNGVEVDDSGDLYVCDQANFRVRKIKPAIGGITTTIAGNGFLGYSGDDGPATNARFAGVRDIAIDHHGNVFLADVDNNRVRKVNAAGIITTVAGTGIAGYNGDNIPASAAQLNFPYSVAVDDSDNLYIADQRNYRIRKVSSTGIITTLAGTGVSGHTVEAGTATTAQILCPLSVITDRKGNVFFIDSAYICKIDTGGLITTFAGNGTVGLGGDNGPATSAEIVGSALAVDTLGNVYLATEAYNTLRKIEGGTGIITTIAGTGFPLYNGDGGSPATATLCFPDGVAVNKDGDIFIGTPCASRVRMITKKTVGLSKIYNDPVEIRIFPNPNHTSCNIFVATSIVNTVQLTIINSSGIEVYRQDIPANITHIIQTVWPPGSYTISAVVGMQYISKQIVVQ